MPSKPDTFAEVVGWLEAQTDPRINPWATMHQSNMLLKAARLLAAAGEEVRAWRQYDRQSNDVDPTEYTAMSLRVNNAVNALDALAPELKENDHAG